MVGASGNLQFLYDNRVVKIAENVLGAPAASVTFSSIPGTFRALLLIWLARSDTAATNASFLVQLNGDTGSSYDSHLADVSGTGTWATAENVANVSMQMGVCTAATAPAGVPGQGWIEFTGYAGTTFQKTCCGQTMYKLANSSTNIQHGVSSGHWRSNVAVNSILSKPGAGSFITGCTFVLYGLN